MKRNKTWARWDRLSTALRPIQRRYARQAVAKAREVLGDKMFSDAATRAACLKYLEVDYDTVMEVTLQGSKASKEAK